jgi:zinc protease
MGYLLPALTDAKFEPARRRAERAAPELREPSLRPGRHGDRRGALSAEIIPYHWMTIGAPTTSRRAHRRRARVLPALLPSGERVAGAGRRHRSREASRSRRVLRRDRRPAAKPARFASCAAPPPRRTSPAARGSRRAAAALHGVALAGDVRGGDAELDLVGRGAVQRQDVAALSRARLRAADRHRVAASQNSRELGSFFQIVATAAPGRTLAESSARSRRRSRRSSRKGRPPREMERCLAQAEAHFLFRLQTVGGFGGKSDQLNAYNVVPRRSRVLRTRSRRPARTA